MDFATPTSHAEGFYMDGSNRLAIDDICDILVEVRDRASREGYGLLVT